MWIAVRTAHLDPMLEKSRPVAMSKKSGYRVRFRHGVCPHIGILSRDDIKKYDFFFENGQRWVETNREVDFVDESRQIAEETGSESGCGLAEQKSVASRYSSRRPKRVTRKKETHRPMDQERPETYTSESQTDASSDEQSSWNVPGNWVVPDEAALSCFDYDELSRDMCFSNTGDPTPWDMGQGEIYTLESPEEAQLFRFFVEKIAVWWDITNSRNIWKHSIPALALRSPILLDAMFLFGSQYIRKTDPSFKVDPFHYHGRLLSQLIPYLNERDGINDEATLAATTLLRAYEDSIGSYHRNVAGWKHTANVVILHSWHSRSKPIINVCILYQQCSLPQAFQCHCSGLFHGLYPSRSV